MLFSPTTFKDRADTVHISLEAALPQMVTPEEWDERKPLLRRVTVSCLNPSSSREDCSVRLRPEVKRFT